MTPKEKATELVEKMNFSHPGHEMYVAKQCALIVSFEMIKQIDQLRKPENTTFWHEEGTQDGYFIREYWEEVKEEINKL